MPIQTLIYDSIEYISISDVMEWIKKHGANGLIPEESAHALVKALIRVKNTKP